MVFSNIEKRYFKLLGKFHKEDRMDLMHIYEKFLQKTRPFDADNIAYAYHIDRETGRHCINSMVTNKDISPVEQSKIDDMEDLLDQLEDINQYSRQVLETNIGLFN